MNDNIARWVIMYCIYHKSGAASGCASVETIMISQRGRVDENIPRWVAMYMAQEISGLRLREIAEFLGLKRTGSIPTIIAKLKLRIVNDRKLARVVERIKSEYDT